MLTDWLTDSNGMSIRLGLFYALRLRVALIVSSYLYILLSCFLKKFIFFTWSYRIRIMTRANITSPGHSRPGRNCNYTPQRSRTGATPSEKFSAISRTLIFFCGRLTPLHRIQSAFIKFHRKGECKEESIMRALCLTKKKWNIKLKIKINHTLNDDCICFVYPTRRSHQNVCLLPLEKESADRSLHNNQRSLCDKFVLVLFGFEKWCGRRSHSILFINSASVGHFSIVFPYTSYKVMGSFTEIWLKVKENWENKNIRTYVLMNGYRHDEFIWIKAFFKSAESFWVNFIYSDVLKHFLYGWICTRHLHKT